MVHHPRCMRAYVPRRSGRRMRKLRRAGGDGGDATLASTTESTNTAASGVAAGGDAPSTMATTGNHAADSPIPEQAGEAGTQGQAETTVAENRQSAAPRSKPSDNANGTHEDSGDNDGSTKPASASVVDEAPKPSSGDHQQATAEGDDHQQLLAQSPLPG